MLENIKYTSISTSFHTIPTKNAIFFLKYTYRYTYTPTISK